ncbi:hypothetical protein [Corynebacterium sp. HS2168-gen11]|uniref:hypothetical protein n=1 Tax=Corynebacterium sp. HS2168-gen11 TaxID=2974027 RepID=UPI00216B4D8F|nr:hypothetical protein [Corynebacterium sp. HS2168-gen11]MCS4536187.1 hypothetical protein [Corynebacterium sp. HS2168-gen11]
MSATTTEFHTRRPSSPEESNRRRTLTRSAVSVATVQPAEPKIAPPERSVRPAKRRFARQLGSQQVIVHRGRRVERPQVDTSRRNHAIMLILAVVFGAWMSLYYSGLATENAFKIDELRGQEIILHNQLETLRRDLENASSTAEIARQAQEMGMVIPNQTGVLARLADGSIQEIRPAGEGTRPIIDVNGQKIQPNVATSDPKATAEVVSSLNATPQLEVTTPRLAPYINAN